MQPWAVSCELRAASCELSPWPRIVSRSISLQALLVVVCRLRSRSCVPRGVGRIGCLCWQRGSKTSRSAVHATQDGLEARQCETGGRNALE